MKTHLFRFPGFPPPHGLFGIAMVGAALMVSKPEVQALVGADESGLLSQEAAAFELESADSAPSSKPLAASPQEFLREQVPTYLGQMESDVKVGQLDRILLACPVILQWQPDNAAVHSLFALGLAASNKGIEARKELEAARAKSPAALPDLCAEALLLLKDGQAEEAAKICQKAIALDKEHAYPWNILGRIALANGKVEEAAGHFAKAIELNPGFQPAHLNLGVICQNKPDPAAAFGHFKEAFRLSPRDGRALYGMAVALEAQGQTADALAVLQQSLLAPRPFWPTLEMLGRLQLSGGQYEEAGKTGARMLAEKMPDAQLFLAEVKLHSGQPILALDAIAKAPPASQRAWLIRANGAILQKDYPAALKALDSLLKLNPEHYGALVTRAVVQLALGEAPVIPPGDAARWGEEPQKLIQFVRAADYGVRKDWKKCLESLQTAGNIVEGFTAAGLELETLPGALVPGEMAPLTMGILLQVQGFREAARERYAEAVRLNAESAAGNYLLAVGLLEKKDREQATRHFLLSLKRAPKFFPALYALGDLAMQSRQADQAMEYLERANKAVPTPAIELKLGIICENTNRADQAEVHYRRYIEGSPKVFVGYNQLAWLFASQGKNLDEALKLANEANTLQPGNASILDTLGWIHFKQGRMPEAIKSLTESLKIAPDSPTVCYHLGAAQLAAGNRDQGKETLEKALKLSADFPEAAEVKRLLGTIK